MEVSEILILIIGFITTSWWPGTILKVAPKNCTCGLAFFIHNFRKPAQFGVKTMILATLHAQNVRGELNGQALCDSPTMDLM